MTELLRALAEPFPREVERTRRKGGTNLTYIPVSEVIARMNRVIGVENWSSETILCQRDALNPDWVIAHVRVTATIDGRDVHRDGWGGQQIKLTKAGDIVDLGDEFKGAESDAFKKACQKFEIGLYLARTDEALEAEAVAALPQPDPAVEGLWEVFRENVQRLDPEQKAALNAFWADYSGGAPKPSKTTASVQDLNALIGECVRLAFPGAEADTDAA